MGSGRTGGDPAHQNDEYRTRSVEREGGELRYETTLRENPRTRDGLDRGIVDFVVPAEEEDDRDGGGGHDGGVVASD